MHFHSNSWYSCVLQYTVAKFCPHVNWWSLSQPLQAGALSDRATLPNRLSQSGACHVTPTPTPLCQGFHSFKVQMVCGLIKYQEIGSLVSMVIVYWEGMCIRPVQIVFVCLFVCLFFISVTLHLKTYWGCTFNPIISFNLTLHHAQHPIHTCVIGPNKCSTRSLSRMGLGAHASSVRGFMYNWRRGNRGRRKGGVSYIIDCKCSQNFISTHENAD